VLDGICNLKLFFGKSQHFFSTLVDITTQLLFGKQKAILPEAG